MDGDRAVIVKRGSRVDVDRLRREGERLQRASHPGVISLLQSRATEDGWELRIGHGGRPVSVVHGLTVPQVAAIAAGVASTLADLHELQVVHGRIEGSHVLIGETGRAVLCGFGEGSAPADPEDDVAALGALLVGLLGTEESGEPIPERRWWGRRRWSGWDRRALLLLADQAVADPASRRPTARRLAASITEAVPGATRAADAREEPRRIWYLRPLVAALVGALLIAAGAHRVFDRESAVVPLVEVARSLDTTIAGPAVEVHTATPVTGSVLSIDGRRYRVGQQGDELLVEDWDCDGVATPALLRPSTGEVFVFGTWIEGGTQTVRPVLQVAGAQALLSEVPDAGCATLSVRNADGALVPVLEQSHG